MTSEILPPVKTVQLENGLNLDILDESKKIAPERWLVRMAARVTIPIDSIGFPPGQDILEIEQLLGKVVVFEQKKERNFVDEKEKEAVFEAVCETFLETTREYLSHADFPRKYVFKLYRERTTGRSRQLQ